MKSTFQVLMEQHDLLSLEFERTSLKLREKLTEMHEFNRCAIKNMEESKKLLKTPFIVFDF